MTSTLRRITLPLLTLILLTCITSCAPKADISVTDLRVEGLDYPLAIDNTLPHFSWKVAGSSQTAYEIEVASSRKQLEKGKADMWVSGLVEGDECVMIPYEGKVLSPRALYYWRVRTHSAQHAAPWSKALRFGVGIISPDTMRGQFIGMGLGQETAVLLMRSFETSTRGIDAALLHVNSLGYHEVYVNGQRAGESVLAPAVSQLDKHSLIVTYDIAPLLRNGSNTLVLALGSGWYKQLSFGASYPGAVVRADLDIVHGASTQPLLQTDDSWLGCASGYKDTDAWRPWQFGSEIIDARVMPQDFTPGSLDKLSWSKVQTPSIPMPLATPQMCQQTIRKETLTAVSVSPFGEDSWLVDMGRIINGMVDIELPPLPEGHEVTAAYAEVLTPEGKPARVMATDHFIASGRDTGDRFCNRFDHRAFRYIILGNLPTEPTKERIRAYRIGMDLPKTGTFESSDDDLNRIHQMLAYTMENLTFSGYMVDCITIERLGYGGDGNASTLSLQNNFDAAPLYLNWLTAWNDAQRPDGGLPHTAPNPYRAGGGPYWCSFIVQAPWRTWYSYGDSRLLERCYPAMRQWLTYVDAHTRNGLLQRWPDTDYRDWYLGDWLAPAGINALDEESITLINNCCLSQCYAELEQIAQKLGLPDDAHEYAQRRNTLNALIHTSFFHPSDSTYASGCQLDLAYPLLVGAVPEELVDDVTHKLTHLRTHLGVGLVGVPVLTEWATRSRNVDFFYNMLKQPDYPGYLYMLNNGASGTWEDWDNPRSYFHNCYNGADSWFYQALGGIVPTSPGYKTVDILPQAPQSLQWVKVTRNTPYGTIRVHWKRTDDALDVDVDIPNGITAHIADTTLTQGSHHLILPL